MIIISILSQLRQYQKSGDKVFEGADAAGWKFDQLMIFQKRCLGGYDVGCGYRQYTHSSNIPILQIKSRIQIMHNQIEIVFLQYQIQKIIESAMKNRVSGINKVPKIKQRRKSEVQELPDYSLPTHQLSSQHVLPTKHQDSQYYSIQAIRRRYLLQVLAKKIRHLIPPSRVPESISQNWQQEERQRREEYIMKANQVSQNERRNMNNVETELGFRYSSWKILQILQGILLIILFWMASLELCILPKSSEEEHIERLFPFAFRCSLTMVLIIKIIIKQIIVIAMSVEQSEYINEYQDNLAPSPLILEEPEYQINKNEDIYKPLLYLLTYLTYLLIDIIFNPEDTARHIILLVVCIVLFERLTKLHLNFESIIAIIESKNLKNQFRLLKLLFLSIGLCHLIALIMYSLTYIHPNRNWLTAIREKITSNQQGYFESQWFHDYGLAMYWAITTIVTVGYGDITPTRYNEILVVSILQLIGTAMFGYMINVIGITVAEIKQQIDDIHSKKNEQFDNYMTTINKMAQQYQISRRLCNKFKNQIIYHEQMSRETPLNSEQETNFLKLMNPTVRNSFTLETNIKVIKKSIFFLTYFTVNFQNEIALKLIRLIYRKGETIKITDEKNKLNIDNTVDNEENYELDESKREPNQEEKYRNSIKVNQNERYIALINSGSARIKIQTKVNNMKTSKYIKTIMPQEGKPTLNVFGYSSVIMNQDIDLVAEANENTVVYLLKRKDIMECLQKNMLDSEALAELREKILQYRNLNDVQAPSLKDITAHYIPNLFLIAKKSKKMLQQRESTYQRTKRRNKLKLITLANYKNRTMMCIDEQKEPRQQQISIGYLNSNYHFENIKLDKQPNHKKNHLQDIGMDSAKKFQNFMTKFNVDRVLQKYHENLNKKIESIQKKQRQEKYRKLRVCFMDETSNYETDNYIIQ